MGEKKKSVQTVAAEYRREWKGRIVPCPLCGQEPAIRVSDVTCHSCGLTPEFPDGSEGRRAEMWNAWAQFATEAMGSASVGSLVIMLIKLRDSLSMATRNFVGLPDLEVAQRCVDVLRDLNGALSRRFAGAFEAAWSIGLDRTDQSDATLRAWEAKGE